MIKAVFFDLYGTLAGFSPSRFEIQSQACKGFGITLTEGGTLQGYGEADSYMTDQNSVHPLRNRNELEIHEFFQEYERRVIAGSGVDVDQETAGEIWKAVRSIPYDMIIYNDVIPVLGRLKDRRLRLGLLSNMNKSGSVLLDKFALTEHLDFAVTSHEVGSEKPHLPIFLAALERAGCQGKESVHVGDQIGSDVQGAEKAGIFPVLIDRDGNHRGYVGCPRIGGMSELEEVLKKID